MTPFDLLVLSVAVFRGTRLVTQDTISDGLRERLSRRAHRTFVRHGFTGEVIEERVGERGDRPITLALWQLSTCPWCMSMWLAGLAVGCFLSWQTVTMYVAYVLAASAVVGLIAEHT